MSKNTFYVYGLFRDLSCSDPFYIGKGNRDRMKHHVIEVANGTCSNRLKACAIKKRLAMFGFVPSKVLFSGLVSEEAFFYERELIAKYGRLDMGTGSLTNLSEGGDGLGSEVSQETRQRMREKALANGSRPPSRKGAVSEKRGLRLSDAQKKKISLSLRTYYASKGKKVKEPKPKKVRIAHNKGQPWTEEQKAAHREIWRLKKLNVPTAPEPLSLTSTDEILVSLDHLGQTRSRRELALVRFRGDQRRFEHDGSRDEGQEGRRGGRADQEGRGGGGQEEGRRGGRRGG